MKISYVMRRFCSKSFNPSFSCCWNCRSNDFKNLFICGKCKYLQDPNQTLDNVNFFQMFEIRQPDMDIDSKYLENKYRNLQKIVHPDKYIPMKNDIINNYSQMYSSVVNEAYETLKNPFKRAEYILKLNGYQVNENTQIDDLEFMEDILDTQQRISESDTEVQNQILLDTNIKIDQLQEYLKEMINLSKLDEAFKTLIYLRYYDRIQSQICALQEM